MRKKPTTPRPLVVIRGGRATGSAPRTTTLPQRHLVALKNRYLSLVDSVRTSAHSGRFAEAGDAQVRMSEIVAILHSFGETDFLARLSKMDNALGHAIFAGDQKTYERLLQKYVDER